MGKGLLREFVEQGWLDRSVTEGYDPYYEPSWFASDSPADDDAWAACDEVGVGCSGHLSSWDF